MRLSDAVCGQARALIASRLGLDIPAARQAALEREPLATEAHLLLARISQDRGDLPEAQQALRRAIYLAPSSVSVHFLLGSLLLRQGEHARGRRCLETAARLVSALPRDATVPSSGGLLAGRLLETVWAYLEPR